MAGNQTTDSSLGSSTRSPLSHKVMLNRDKFNIFLINIKINLHRSLFFVFQCE